MTQSRYPLRLSETLRKEATLYAQKEKTSLNSFIEIAVAERLSALKTAEFFDQRGQNPDWLAFARFMNRETPGIPIRKGDETPEGINFVEQLLEEPAPDKMQR